MEGPREASWRRDGAVSPAMQWPAVEVQGAVLLAWLPRAYQGLQRPTEKWWDSFSCLTLQGISGPL